MSYTNTKTPKSERDEARTPLWLFRWLDSRFGFSVDLAASADNTLCEAFYSKKESALMAPWGDAWPESEAGFLNPPYSKLGPWLIKAAQEAAKGFTTVMVIPQPNGEAHTRILFDNATDIFDIVGRVNFLRPDGTEMKGNNRGTCIVVFDPNASQQRRWYFMRDEIKSKYS